MCDRKPARDSLAALFRDVVLVLGGVFAVRGTDSETVEQVARGLESAYRRARHACQHESPPGKGRLSPHPAIARLLCLTDHEETER